MSFCKYKQMEGRATLLLVTLVLLGFIRESKNANSNQLIFNPTSMSWISAATWCQIKGGDLITVDSQSVVLMIDWYKNNNWSSHWSANVWTGLYSIDASHAYWQGSCQMLDFESWAMGQSFSNGAPCTYMDSVDLLWHFDDCSNQHHVVCQIPKGNCSFDDTDMAINKLLTSLPAVKATTLDICKSLCDNYLNGSAQCWAVKYQASAHDCYMYASDSLQEYISSTPNKNHNVFYTTKQCYSSAVVIENEPTISFNETIMIDTCLTLLSSTQNSSQTGTTTQNVQPATSATSSAGQTSTKSDFPYSTTSTLDVCRYECQCPPQNITTKEMLENRLEELKKILQIDETTTSSYIRKHTSVMDDRPSVHTMGSIGVIFLILIIGFIIASDLINFKHHAKMGKCKRSQKRKRAWDIKLDYLNV